MPMPPTAVNKDHLLESREHYVRASWKIGSIEAEPVAESMDNSPHDQFGRRIVLPYA